MYKNIYSFFYDKLGSEKYTSKSASISIISFFLIVISLICINIFSIYLLKYDLLKRMNSWKIVILIIVLYIVFQMIIKKQIRK